MFEVFKATTSEQKQRLYELRYEVFTQEQGKFVDDADHDRRVIVDVLDAHADHYGLTKDGQVIGAIRCVVGRRHATHKMERVFSLDLFSRYVHGSFAFSGKFCIKKEHRHQRSLGTVELLRLCYASSASAGALIDFMYCNPYMVRFYEQLGYRRYRSCFEDEGLGLQVPMVLLLDDRTRLESLGSAFAVPASARPHGAENVAWFHHAFPDYQVSNATWANHSASLVRTFTDGRGVMTSPFLDKLEPDEVSSLISRAAHLRIDAGTKVVRQDDIGHELFLIIDGVAGVMRPRPPGEPALLATLERGDVFGEISVISGHRRTADVLALTDLEVIVLDQFTLMQLIERTPAIATKILRNLCSILGDRLAKTSSLVPHRIEARSSSAVATSEATVQGIAQDEEVRGQ